MDTGVVVAIVTVIVVIAGVAGFWLYMRSRDHPEDTASHWKPDTAWPSGSPPIPPYPGTDRPGDPGAEGMAVPAPGEVAPGPVPEKDSSESTSDLGARNRVRPKP